MGAIYERSHCSRACPVTTRTSSVVDPLWRPVAPDVLRTISDPTFSLRFAQTANGSGAVERLAAGTPRVREARGRGLMWGLESTSGRPGRRRGARASPPGADRRPTVIRNPFRPYITRRSSSAVSQSSKRCSRDRSVIKHAALPSRSHTAPSKPRGRRRDEVHGAVRGDRRPLARSNYDLAPHQGEYVVALAPPPMRHPCRTGSLKVYSRSCGESRPRRARRPSRAGAWERRWSKRSSWTRTRSG